MTLNSAYRYEHCGKKYVDFCEKAGLVEIKNGDPAMCCLTQLAESLIEKDKLQEFISEMEKEEQL